MNATPMPLAGATVPPLPMNEPVLDYAPGSPERVRTEAALAQLAAARHEMPAVIGGRPRTGGGEALPVVQPHARHHVLGTVHEADARDTHDAVAAALAAAPDWAAASYDERAAVFLKAADLLAGPWRARLVAATMLGQSKTFYQAEIDAACELVDFWRFNVAFGRQVLAEQPAVNSPGVWNRLDHRPLEGFVYAVTPFNFTAIAGNLPTAPALMGNTVLWKPSVTQQLAATLTLDLLREAGLPDGVVNLLPGRGPAVSEVALASPHLAGLHFTGSTATFQHLWRTIGENVAGYRTYPRIVGETGGKGFVVAHPDADPDALVTALLRGAFDYQGQKCSAASRAYVPASLWRRIGPELVARTEALAMGPVTDGANFLGAVIDDRAYAKHAAVLAAAHADPGVEVVAGGTCCDTEGWFVRPTVAVVADPHHAMLATEHFGPVLTVHVWDDGGDAAARATAWTRTLHLVDGTSPYALTGAVFATGRAAVAEALTVLRQAAGNVYVNDKPTGAVVGQQPFGGARASGTNDKAGAPQNLARWTSVRTVKETFVPPTDHRYPHQG